MREGTPISHGVSEITANHLLLNIREVSSIQIMVQYQLFLISYCLFGFKKAMTIKPKQKSGQIYISRPMYSLLILIAMK